VKPHSHPSRRIRKLNPRAYLGIALMLGVGCSGEIGGSEGYPFSSGGSTGSGGSSAPGSGGVMVFPTPTGGRPATPTGGRAAASSGGAPTGGSPFTGGSPSSGTGGSADTGGRASGVGGSVTGGRTGFPPSGGRASGGTASGGKAGGGAPSQAGAPSGGGGGVVSNNCTEANRSLSNNGTGKHCGYTYEYWKDSGNGTLTLTPQGFDVEWSNINNLLGRKGVRPGSDSLVVTYEADYQPNGNSYLCVYGWTTNPLVEYYIVDSWGNWRPPGGEGRVGVTIMSDGGSYELYRIPRSGANIQGNGAFTQYWSVRTDKKVAGAITVKNHFDAWRNNGMPMGSLYEVSMNVEGYQSAGKASVKFSIR